jgi:hypothetical protein
MLEPKVMLTLGEIPNRVDILTDIDGVTTDAVWATRIASKLDGSTRLVHRSRRAFDQQARRQPSEGPGGRRRTSRWHSPHSPSRQKVRAKKAPKRR